MMSVADHHMVPGKKLWTWGNGAAGRQWDHILTDNDGPYIELMVGAYSDNQPDYSWLQPNETKSFSMYWYPFREIGGVKKANLDAGVNLDAANGRAKVGFYTTANHTAASVMLKAGDKILLQETTAIGPAKAYTKEIVVPAGIDEQDLRASISVNGKELVAYSPIRLRPEPMPKAVVPPGPPEQFKSTEELYLAGQRIEQFHNPGLDPAGLLAGGAPPRSGRYPRQHVARHPRVQAGPLRRSRTVLPQGLGSPYGSLHHSERCRSHLLSRPQPEGPGQDGQSV